MKVAVIFAFLMTMASSSLLGEERNLPDTYGSGESNIQNEMTFREEVHVVDTLIIDNPIVVEIVDAGQEYLISKPQLKSLSESYSRFSDSLMNREHIPLYSCNFFKFLYYCNTSKEDYESFFKEKIDPSTVLRFNCPKLSTIEEDLVRNISIKDMKTDTKSFMRIKLSGNTYNYYMYKRVMDGPLSRPLYFENPDSAVYMLFPIYNDKHEDDMIFYSDSISHRNQ